MISGRNKKRLLLGAAFVLSTGLFASAQGPWGPPPGGGGCFWNCKPQAVPDGGSTLAYVLGVGSACVGAMFLRARVAKKQSA
jgi:hypothetical protein